MALDFLASEKQVADIAALIKASLATYDDDDDDLTSIDLGDSGTIEWTEGVEKYKSASVSELCAAIGIKDAHLPMFNVNQDPDGGRDPWDPQYRSWFADSKNTIPLTPRWHQLVGITGMIERMFAGHPILLMDGVGLGKTLQVVGVITVLTQFREFYEANKRFPGAFGAFHRDLLLFNLLTCFI